MPTFNKWRGDAQAKPQIERWTIEDAEPGDTFTVTINRKEASYTLDADDVTASGRTNNEEAMVRLAAACTSEADDSEEFSELTFVVVNDSDGNPDYIQVTGEDDGTPYTATLSTTDASTFDVKVTVVQHGSAGKNQIQQITLPSGTTGGTFTLTFGNETTAAINFDDEGTDIQTALLALDAFTAGDLEVLGGEQGPWTVEFKQNYAKMFVDLLVATGSLTGIGTVKVTRVADGDAGTNEKQTIQFAGTPTGGTFTLEYQGDVSGSINYTDSAATLKTKIEGLAGITTVNVVKFATGHYEVEFVDPGAQQVSLLIGNGASLTGAPTVGVTTVREGSAGDNERQLVEVSFGSTNSSQIRMKPGAGGGFWQSSPYFWFLKAEDNAARLRELIKGTGLGITNADVTVRLQRPDDGSSDTGLPGSGTHWYLVEFRNGWGSRAVNDMGFESTIATVTAKVIANTGGDDDGDTNNQGQVGGMNAVDEQQRVELLYGPTSGNFTLTFRGQTTGNLTWDESAADIKTALELLSTVTTVTVTGNNGGPWTVEFDDPGSQDVVPMTGASVSLSGSTVHVFRSQNHVNSTNEKQRVELTGGPSGGTFTLTFNFGTGNETTAAVAWDATAADVVTAIEGLTTPVAGDVSVNGINGGPWVVEFIQNLAATNYQLGTGSGASLTGGTVTVAVTQNEVAAVNEKQKVELLSDPTGGTFTIDWNPGGGAETSSAIAFNASSAAFETGMVNMASVDAADLHVTGVNGGPWTVEFMDTYAATDVQRMVGDGSSLTGGSGTQTLTKTTNQSPTGPNWFNEADNWSLGTAPANDETLVFEESDISCKYGLSQATVNPEALIVRASFTGQIGLPRYTGSYVEYRDTELRLGTDGQGAFGTITVEIGEGEGSGSDLIRLNFGDKQVDVTVQQTGSSTDGNVPSINMIGSHASNRLVHQRGSVGIAYFEEQTATFASVLQAYVDSVETDAELFIGDGCTLTDLTKTGGTLELQTGADQVLHFAGETAMRGSEDVRIVEVRGGTVFSDTEGILGHYGSISGITKANPAVVTTSAVHNLATGDVVRISGGDMTEVDQREFTVNVLTTTTFELVGEDSTSHTVYTTGAIFARLGSVVVSSDGILDFSRSLEARTVAPPIDVYGDDSDVKDPRDKITTSSYQSGQFALRLFNAGLLGDLGARNKRIVRQ